MVEPSGLLTNSVCVWSRQPKINLPMRSRMYPRARPHPVLTTLGLYSVRRARALNCACVLVSRDRGFRVHSPHPVQGAAPGVGHGLRARDINCIAFHDCANVDRVYRDARSRTRDRTGGERGASLS